MTETRWTRVGPVAGILGVVLVVVSLVLTGSDAPDFIDDPQKVADYYAGDSGKLIAGIVIDVLSTILMLVFVAALYVRLRGAGGARVWPLAAFGGGVAMCAMFHVYDVVNLAAVFRAEEDGQIAAPVAASMHDISNLALGLAGASFAGLMIGASAFASLETGALPRWLCWISFVIALGLLIGPIAWAFLVGLLLWIVVVSVLMLRSPAVDTAAPGASVPG